MSTLRIAAPGPAPSIDRLLTSGAIVPHFQPIVSARQKAIIGLEALSRGQWNDQLLNGNTLFDLAKRAGLQEQLGRVCRQRAIATFAAIAERPDDLLLFLNLDVPSRQTPAQIAQALHQAVLDAGLSPAGVAIEILENEFDDMERLRELTDFIRQYGFLIVLDDVGAGHSNLNRISVIQPDVIKVDRSLIADINVNYHKRGTLKGLIDLGRKIGALVVVEGIETEAEAIVSLELGADLLQGFFLGRPDAAGALAAPALAGTFDRVERLARTFRDYMVGKINERRLQHRRFNVVVNQMLCDLTGAEVERFDEILSRTIRSYPNVECAYVLDQFGIQVTDTICNPHVGRREHGVLFRPAPRGSDHSLKEYYYVLLDVELHKYTTDPYVSTASGNVSQTISTYFLDAQTSKIYVLCVDVHE